MFPGKSIPYWVLGYLNIRSKDKRNGMQKIYKWVIRYNSWWGHHPQSQIPGLCFLSLEDITLNIGPWV